MSRYNTLEHPEENVRREARVAVSSHALAPRRPKCTDSIDKFFRARFNTNLERELHNAHGRFSDKFRAEYLSYMHTVV